jgi:Domain of unknown function (DUF4760)
MYKLPKIENALNNFIGFIFYYRLVFVLISLSIISFIIKDVYNSSNAGDEYKNSALVLTCGSVIIGIFYSIINYEHNQRKFKHDVKLSREMLTFTTACKMHEAETINHFKSIKSFYNANKQVFAEGKLADIDIKLKAEPDTRVSFIVIFNYFESIAIGIEQGIMDEVFMKEFFKTIYRDCYNEFGTYIEFMRKENNSPRAFHKFTALAKRWESEI